MSLTSDMTTSNRLSIDATLENVGSLSPFVDGFCRSNGLGEEMVSTFVLAFEELLANVVNHGSLPDRNHRVEISLSVSDGKLVADYFDDGAAFNPLAAPKPNLGPRMEDRRVGGLGLYLIQEMMDDLRYSRENDRNHLTLAKTLPQSA